MIDINLDDYPIGDKVAVHCDTEEQAKELLEFLHAEGAKWNTFSSLLSHNNYGVYRGETCYCFCEGNEYSDVRVVTFANMQYLEGEGYKILEFEDIAEKKDDSVPHALFDFLCSLMQAT